MKESYRYIFLSIFVFLFGCASNFKLRDSSIDSLSIAVEFSDETNPELTKSSSSIFSDVINEYKGKLKLSEAGSSSENIFKIEIGKTKIAGTKERLIALGISTAGIALPIYLISQESNFVVGFVYPPFNKTKIDLQLSDNLEKKDSHIRKSVSTLSLSGNRASQVEKQKRKIVKQILTFLSKIEKHNKSVKR